MWRDLGEDMGDDRPDSQVDPSRGRRDARWMAMWPVDVLVSGGYGFLLVCVAVLYVWLQDGGGELPHSVSTYLGRAVGFGLAHAVAGALGGVLVGLTLTFLVGDASGRRARTRARRVAATAHAAGVLVLMVLVGGAGFSGMLFIGVSSVLMCLVAGRWHDRLASRPRVEDFYAH